MFQLLPKMQESRNCLNEVVVVGYGTQKKANVTGAVAQISGDVLDRRSILKSFAGSAGYDTQS